MTKRFGIMESGRVHIHAESRYQPGDGRVNAKCAQTFPANKVRPIRARKGPMTELTCEGCIRAEEREPE